MASIPQNNFAAGPRLIVTGPFAPSVDFNQGDLVKVASNALAPLAAVADAVHGMIDETNPTTSLLDTVTKASVLRPGAGVLVRLELKSGDTAAYGDQLYLSSNVATNPQEVSTDSSNSAAKVGVCRELSPVTGTSGRVRILVEFLGA